MKIRMLVSRSGADGAQNRGDEIDVPSDEAKRMIDAGQAEVVRSGKAERAVKKPASEKAVK